MYRDPLGLVDSFLNLVQKKNPTLTKKSNDIYDISEYRTKQIRNNYVNQNAKAINLDGLTFRS